MPINIDNMQMSDGKLRESAMPYLYDIAEGNVKNHATFSQIGYTGALGTTGGGDDIWSATGSYVFPTTAGAWEAVSSDNTQDIGTILKTAVADAGGSTTTLVDADGNFVVAGIVAGDCLILDKSGATPEYGFITTVSATTLTVAGGFSQGGVGTSRNYDVIDFSSKTGAHAVQIDYLTSAFAEKREIVILNGTTAVPTVNNDCYRLNGLRMIASGVTGGVYVPKGSITVRPSGGGTTYGFITAGFTRMRGAIYTVPASKILYVSQIATGYAVSGTPNMNYARLFLRANYNNGFNTGSLFYTHAEILTMNNDVPTIFEIPMRFTAGTDIKMSGLGTLANMPASVSMRGWLETT